MAGSKVNVENLRGKCFHANMLPDFSLNSVMSGKQWLMLFFYPSAWSFVCPTEILAFNARMADFSSRKCAIAFASTDSEHVLKAWNSIEKEEGGLGGVHVPLLSDRSHRLSRDYGVLIEEKGVAQRSTFIIDPTGTIRSVTTSDANIGRNVEESKRMLDALQFSDDFGEGCPAGWERGDPGIKMSGLDEKLDPVQLPTELPATPPTSKRPTRPAHVRGNSWTSRLQMSLAGGLSELSE